MKQMAETGKKTIFFILNKVEPDIETFMKNQLDAAAIAGTVPKDHSIFMQSLEGKPLAKDVPEIDAICRRILAD